MKKKFTLTVTGILLFINTFSQCWVKPLCDNEVTISGSLSNKQYTGSTCFNGNGTIENSVNINNWDFISFKGNITHEQVPNMNNQNFYIDGNINLENNNISLTGVDTIFVNGNLTMQSNSFNLNGKVIVILKDKGSTVKIQGKTYNAGDTLKGPNYPDSGEYIAVAPCQDVHLLPINLAQFTGMQNSNNILLVWNTSSETNSKGFDIERSTDNKVFNNIGYVTTKAVNGNSSRELSYNYTDAYPIERAVNYYRLKLIDIDGSFIYSKIISVRAGNNSSPIVHPNPVSNSLKIANAYVGSVYTILNIYGEKIQSGIVPSSDVSLDVSGLSAGVYIIRIEQKNNSAESVKFIKK
ncbi:MAG: T9SS type A sorting domain-containing protein [Arachidicoccus sp.]|nr:T9SS type A sorting domain-containing protein [Arachidicoccus sp.]